MAGEIVWRVGFDQQEAKTAGRTAGKEQAKEAKKGEGGGAFAGGFFGSILGNLLSSVQQLFAPLSAIATLLVAALFPLLKPFLILFLKVGLLLFKWINSLLGTDSSVKGLTGKGDDGSLTVGQKGKELGLSIGKIAGGLLVAAGLLSSLAVGLGVAVPAVLGALASMPVTLLVGLGILTAILAKQFFEFGLWLGAVMLEGVTIFKDTMSGWVDNLKISFEILTLKIDNLWRKFLTGLEKSLKIMSEFGSWIWNNLINIFSVSFNVLNDFGSWIWNSLTNIFTSAFNVLSDIGSFIKNSIMGFFGFGGGSKSVNDAIITPNGDVIRTNPNDYLIATKNPGSLGGSGGGSGSNVNVNINGGLITDDVARDIGRILQRELNLGGRF